MYVYDTSTDTWASTQVRHASLCLQLTDALCSAACTVGERGSNPRQYKAPRRVVADCIATACRVTLAHAA